MWVRARTYGCRHGEPTKWLLAKPIVYRPPGSCWLASRFCNSVYLIDSRWWQWINARLPSANGCYVLLETPVVTAFLHFQILSSQQSSYNEIGIRENHWHVSRLPFRSLQDCTSGKRYKSYYTGPGTRTWVSSRYLVVIFEFSLDLLVFVCCI